MKVRVLSLFTAGAMFAGLAASSAPSAVAARGPSAWARHAVIAQRAETMAGMLYKQNNHDAGLGFTSQNFETSLDAYDTEAADDFTVTGAKWRIKTVNVTGVYYNGPGPAVSENVTFYKDKSGKPGAVINTQTVTGTDRGGTFAIKLPTRVTLKAGTYWLSVQANMDFATGGQWGWEARTLQVGTAAMWRNPGDGFGTGCTKYADLGTCLGFTGAPDLMFALKGVTP